MLKVILNEIRLILPKRTTIEDRARGGPNSTGSHQPSRHHLASSFREKGLTIRRIAEAVANALLIAAARCG